MDNNFDDYNVDRKALNRKRIQLISVIAIIVVLLLIIAWLLLNRNDNTEVIEQKQQEVEAAQEQIEQAQYLVEIANSKAELAAIDSEFKEFNLANGEQKVVSLKADSIAKKYNAARAQIEKLLAEIDKLNTEKSNNPNKQTTETDTKKLAELQSQIAALKDEISTLRAILKEYTEQIRDLKVENQQLNEKLTATTSQLTQSQQAVTQLSETNKVQQEKLVLASKLNVTGVELIPLNDKRSKREKNIEKAKYLQVSFNISPNNTTAPGPKKIYARILSPEGELLGSGGSFSYEGTTQTCTDAVTVEYANEEIGGVSIYWPVTSTLTPGSYHVELFCDGYMLASKNYTLNKK